MSAPADRRIRLLDSRLANQIAAGEVVERPASVLKELLENAIDAGAGRIEVDLERGGVQLIRVRDDGCGIARDELPLALCRHATSKLYSSEELERIGTLGFRGEALAAIASVSRLTLTSRRADEPHAWSVEPGREPAPASQTAGTTVEVRDLFHNVPARRKFLRGARTELAHLEEVARRIALSRSELALTVRHDGRRLLDLRPADGESALLRRVGEACGAPFTRDARPAELAAAGMELRGWVLPAEVARPQSDLQYFFVNGRVIRDRLIAHAVRGAYGDAVSEGRYPGYLLYLTLDPALVDVNVHPTKHEVRFRDARFVHDFIMQGVRRALAEGMLFPASMEPLVAEPARPESARGPRSAPAPGARSYAPAPGARSYAPAARPPRSTTAQVAEAGSLYQRLFPERPAAAPQPLGRVGRFLLAGEGERLWLVETDAALAMLLAGRLRDGFEAGGVTSQPLLVPESVPLAPGEIDLLEDAGADLARLGYDLDAAGANAVVLRAAPALLRRVPGAAQVAVLAGWRRAGGPPPFAALAALGGEELPEARDPSRLLQALAALGWPAGVARRFEPEQLARLLSGPAP